MNPTKSNYHCWLHDRCCSCCLDCSYCYYYCCRYAQTELASGARASCAPSAAGTSCAAVEFELFSNCLSSFEPCQATMNAIDSRASTSGHCHGPGLHRRLLLRRCRQHGASGYCWSRHRRANGAAIGNRNEGASGRREWRRHHLACAYDGGSTTLGSCDSLFLTASVVTPGHLSIFHSSPNVYSSPQLILPPHLLRRASLRSHHHSSPYHCHQTPAGRGWRAFRTQYGSRSVERQCDQ